MLLHPLPSRHTEPEVDLDYEEEDAAEDAEEGLSFPSWRTTPPDSPRDHPSTSESAQRPELSTPPISPGILCVPPSPQASIIQNESDEDNRQHLAG